MRRAIPSDWPPTVRCPVTVLIGIAAPDGIVLASDSRLTRTIGESHRILSDNAQKVFEVGGFGVATSGMAFLGNDTIAGVMDRFIAQEDGKFGGDVKEFAARLGKFFDARFQEILAVAEEEWSVEEDGYAIVFLVGGYDEVGVGNVYEVAIPTGEVEEAAASTTDSGVVWRGQTSTIRRLLKGLDWGHPALGDFPEDAQEVLGELEYIHLFPTTIQDAVDYARFLVQTTIDMQRFSDGTAFSPGLVPGCGGPVQILAIERSGTEWVGRDALE